MTRRPKRYRGKWLRLDEENGLQHVIPETDTKPHSTATTGQKRSLASSDCPCRPKVSITDDGFLIVHNSFQDAAYLDHLLASGAKTVPRKKKGP